MDDKSEKNFAVSEQLPAEFHGMATSYLALANWIWDACHDPLERDAALKWLAVSRDHALRAVMKIVKAKRAKDIAAEHAEVHEARALQQKQDAEVLSQGLADKQQAVAEAQEVQRQAEEAQRQAEPIEPAEPGNSP